MVDSSNDFIFSSPYLSDVTERSPAPMVTEASPLSNALAAIKLRWLVL
jgi:hypothetical protein